MYLFSLSVCQSVGDGVSTVNIFATRGGFTASKTTNNLSILSIPLRSLSILHNLVLLFRIKKDLVGPRNILKGLSSSSLIFVYYNGQFL